MNVRILSPVRSGAVRAIASKSEAHRLLICAALADGATFVGCPERSEDIDATARCLESLGAAVSYERDGFFVTPIPRETQSSAPRELNCRESGSTLRFLLPVCGALGLRTSLHMSGRLPARPLSALAEEMTSHGCTLFGQGRSPLICEGRLQSGCYALPGNVSSQFISGLLFALPLLEGDSLIRVNGVLESRPYVELTLEALRLFGVTVREEDGPVFHIPGGQVGRSPQSVRAGGDWSNAAFWLSAGAIGQGKITCLGLNPASRQGDRAIVELLARFGARVTWDGDAVTVSPGALRGIALDAGDTPDLVPVIAAVASVAKGKTTIYNAGRLRIKESDRLRTVASSLSALGADITETEDGLVIVGKQTLSGGEMQSFGDHRIAMTAAILSAACTGPVVIRDAEAVGKSYPGFFEDFRMLGGIYEIISQ